MDPLDEKLKQRAKEEPFPLPEEFSQRLETLCQELEAQPARKKRVFHPLRWTAGAAAALILLLPNVSVSAQAAMEQIPVLGSIVRVVTLRNYFYEDGHSFASVSIPSVSQGGPGGDAVNEAVQEYTDRLLTQFQQDIQDTGEGYQGLDVSYEVTCDTDTWFTLRINALQVQASGHEMVRYYHIDKTTGEMVTLSDLFPQGTDYVTPLSQEVLRQMEGEPDFFPEDFNAIDPQQSFYWDDEGDLTLVFDEAEVAPASRGVVEFHIPQEVTQPLGLKAP